MKTRTVAMLMLGAFALSGCKQALDQLNRDLDALNQGISAPGPTNERISKSDQSYASPTAQTTKIQMIVPNEGKTKSAIDEALPTIKKVIAIHQCAKSEAGTLPLNALALPGVKASASGLNSGFFFPNSYTYMQYHDRNKCLSVRAIDSFTMPALNALKFRVIYFADDSGETVNLIYRMRKTDNNQWLLSDMPDTH